VRVHNLNDIIETCVKGWFAGEFSLSHPDPLLLRRTASACPYSTVFGTHYIITESGSPVHEINGAKDVVETIAEIQQFLDPFCLDP